jgi:hypothetical protein
MNNNFSAIRESGFRALLRELGVAGTVTFMRQFENGSGDYTAERGGALSGITIDDISESVRRRKEGESVDTP